MASRSPAASGSASRATSRRSGPSSGRAPGLATILVGDDPGSAVYVAGKQKACPRSASRAFNYPLAADTSREELVELIERLNGDDAVDGILLQLPLPDHLDGVELTGLIDPDKDVDGLTPVSAGRLALGLEGLRPCTPPGVMTLLEAAGAQLEGAEAVVIGRSNLFGKPMAAAAARGQRDRDNVPLAHARPRRGLPPRRRPDRRRRPAADGAADWVKPGAIVIDVGMNRTDDGLCGDVDFDAVKEVAAAITPVPGGVGPMTIAFLLRNTLQAARMAQTRRVGRANVSAERDPLMDVRRLRGGELLAGAGATGLLADMFVDWFGGASGWESLTIGRIVIAGLIVCAFTLVVLTVTSRTVAMACSAAVITIGVGALALWLVFYRVVVNEPGPNALVSVEAGAYLGLLLVLAITAGAWITLSDERTQATASLEQTERVLAVRGARRPAPPPRDPGRPASRT